MSEEQKREEKGEKIAQSTKKRFGKEDSKHPRACSRVGGETSQMDRGGPGDGRLPLRCEE